MDPLVGRDLGPYALLETLGAGGMGRVYRAVHRRLRQPRAVKVLPVALAQDPAFVTRFVREATIAAGLRHPNIVVIHDVGEQDGLHYIAMELLEGRTLQDVIRTEAPLGTSRAIHLLAQLADALGHAHAQGVVHRDVKPANAIVRPGDHVTLLDFGIVVALQATRVTSTGVLVGTPHYLAPEVWRGAGRTVGTDLYALGIVAYELLTGQVPFGGPDTPAIMHGHLETPPPSPRSLRPDLSQAIERALLRQLAKDPAARYPTARAFVDALAAGAEPIIPSVDVQGRQPRVSRAPMMAGIAGLILLAVVVAALQGLPAPSRTGAAATSSPAATLSPVAVRPAPAIATGTSTPPGAPGDPGRSPLAPSKGSPSPAAAIPTLGLITPTTAAAAPSPHPASLAVPPRALQGHSGIVLTVAFAPDGQTLASGASDNSVRLWRASDGALVQTLEGHTDSVEGVAFAPDGQMLVSGSVDRSVRLWRAADGTLLRVLEGHASSVKSVTFSLDGQMVASGSAD